MKARLPPGPGSTQEVQEPGCSGETASWFGSWMDGLRCGFPGPSVPRSPASLAAAGGGPRAREGAGLGAELRRGQCGWGPGPSPSRTVGEPPGARRCLGWSNRAESAGAAAADKGPPRSICLGEWLPARPLSSPSARASRSSAGSRERGTARTGLPGSLCTPASPDP